MGDKSITDIGYSEFNDLTSVSGEQENMEIAILE